MAKIINNEKGFKVIEMSSNEFLSIGGLSFCDSCNTPISKGYYIAVLNKSICEKDYIEWCNRAIRYDEDIPYELSKFEQMKNALGID